MSRVSIFNILFSSCCVYSNNDDFEKVVQFLNSKRGEKQKQKTQEKTDTKKKEMKFLKSYRYDCAWCSTLSLFLSAFFFLPRVLLRTLNRSRNLRLGCLPSFLSLLRLFSSSFQLVEKLCFFSSSSSLLFSRPPNISGMRMLRRRYWRSSSTASNPESREYSRSFYFCPPVLSLWCSPCW